MGVDLDASQSAQLGSLTLRRQGLWYESLGRQASLDSSVVQVESSLHAVLGVSPERPNGLHLHWGS